MKTIFYSLTIFLGLLFIQSFDFYSAYNSVDDSKDSTFSNREINKKELKDLFIELKYRENKYNKDDESLFLLQNDTIALFPKKKYQERTDFDLYNEFEVRQKFEFECGNKTYPNVIYGVDNRKDIFEVNKLEPQRISNAVCAIVLESNFDRYKNKYNLRTEKYGVRKNLCNKNEKFYNQPSCPFCTGFAINDSIIVTAKHSLINKNSTEFRFIFGYKIIELNGEPKCEYSENDIYRGNLIDPNPYENYNQNYITKDWIFFKLTKKIENYRIISDFYNENISLNDSLYILGYPSGLPLKYADNAYVTINNLSNNYFKSNLDAFGGNSGSPVFNYNNKLVGMLVRGARDFEETIQIGDCKYLNKCISYDCKGEEIIRITEIMNDFKKIVDLSNAH